ncbi:MAG: 23S rRNA (uracil(1939)-C(5))-methyltransferase RlmD [Synechococcales cyanobacterium K44_A2020_017]|nr:23S rRNA (uracil(1939)-C(5))-methyltransferase RlmD [Synechococcales cyanobacterium K32_A2020_035]MBF2095150.1 23S rRNA (uracil(1939)-C(5))-methyltransferase RlmD [Synechococcales cyanobacterium K44_A2020_017]
MVDLQPSELDPTPAPDWQQGDLIALDIDDLSSGGDGVGRWQGRVVFVPDSVPGDHAEVRLVRVKRQYAHGKLRKVITPSPHRVRPACIVADKCGGCQWQVVSYEQQLQSKYQQVVQALERIGGLENPPVDQPLPSAPLAYRNKVTYPLAMSGEKVQAGYYQKGSHRLVNLNQCPVQDERLNPLLAEIKQDIQRRGWPIYREKPHRGLLRHVSFRIGRRTGELLLTLVSTDWDIPGIEEQAHQWLNRYPDLVGVCVNLNGDRTNAIFGPETRCVAGQHYLTEQFANLTFHIQSTTFFQVNTEQAEALLNVILQELALTGTERIVDVYCGIGTLTLSIAQQAESVIGIELQPEAAEQGQDNAILNGIANTVFLAGSAERLLAETVRSLSAAPDVILLDPPRRGCDPFVLETLLEVMPERIVYVSCNPATLARDLMRLCESGYRLARVQPVDFFPQTAHIECAAFLVRR